MRLVAPQYGFVSWARSGFLCAAMLAGCGDAAAPGANGLTQGDAAAGGTAALDASHALADVSTVDARPDTAVPDALPFIDARVLPDAAPADSAVREAGAGGRSDAGSPPDAHVPECHADLDCDDGFFCNGAERCDAGVCVPDPRPPCTDDLPCTQNLCGEEQHTCAVIVNDGFCAATEICDPKLGCVVPEDCVDDAGCDDGLPCNGLEHCDNGQCRSGQPVVCADAVACTVDTCDDTTGACTSVPDHANCAPGELCDGVTGCTALPPCHADNDCDDGLFCNGAETCDLDTGLCHGGPPPIVDDAVDCTVDVCSEAAAGVTHTPANARCSDGLFCNGFEICHPVDGCRPGAPPVLEDGVGCTTGRCDEAADFVEQIPDAAACDDGLFCNGAEVCDPLRDCQPGAPPAVNDGVGCTVDACNEAARTVTHHPDNTLCDNGVFCDGSDVCDPVRGCQPGAPVLLDDGLDCTDDVCVEARQEVTHLPVDARCDDGLYCDGEEICVLGIGCEGGPPPAVDDAVDCTTDTCDEGRRTVLHSPVDAACDNGLTCDGTEVCDVVRGCLPGSTPETDDGVACTLDLCDPVTGAVTHVPDDRACNDGLFCNGAETCDAQRGCLAGTAPGLTDNVACTADTCDEATRAVVHTPESARCDDGLFCDGAETCDAVRGCQAGAPPVLTDNVACTSDTCDEANDRIVHSPDDGACSDGAFCNGAETCDAVRGCLAGVAPAVDDNVPCTTDACDEAADRITHTPVNARCDDGAFCNGPETCDAARGCLAGTPPVVADNVACTTDTCDEATDRVVHTPNNAACGDGLFCNGTETCDAVRGCLAGAPPVLTDNVACTSDTCDEANDRVNHAPDNAACGDGLFCNGAETCDAALGCRPGVAPVLTDNVACTTDACDEVNDRVTHTVDNAACSDGLFCNGAETCDAVLGCRAGAPPVVADNVACTTDTCDEATDRVLHTPNNGACSDGLFCNGAETCDAALGCRPGVAPVLTDNVACTSDTCDEANDRVNHAPDNAACSDGLFCNGAETCDAALGCRPGVAPVLTDNVACTTDACDEVNDRVTHTADNAACSDGLFCNGAETCDAVLGCRAGAPPVVADNVACTDDSCDEVNDRVVHAPNNGVCSDGQFCNGAETCDVALGCRPGVAPVLTDNVACTTDACDEVADRVTHTANNAACSDGLFCNGAETCDVALGCRPGVAPVQNDNVACTDDSCDEVNDRVVHAANNARCDNALVCDGSETCDAVLGCRAGNRAADGTVCLAAPRNICLVGACTASRCGDRYVDAALGETCDDGNVANNDGCSSVCHTEGLNPNYNGLFGVVPSLVYSCVDLLFGSTVVNVNASQLVFSVAGNILSVSGAPVVMTQNPAPVGANFSVSGVIAGGCTETYTLAGSFSDANHWCGVFNISFTGAECAISTCVNQTINTCGTRL